MPPVVIDVRSADGHTSQVRLHAGLPGGPRLFWLPALGVTAQKYDAFGQALAAEGITLAVHEWRGNGRSSQRAARGSDWGYRELLRQDLPASLQACGAGRWHFGGHSLGGQLAAMFAAGEGVDCAGVLLMATGVPHARHFRGRQRLGITLFAHSLPVLTHALGYYPGHQLRFAGREAAQLMRDWGATARSGRYLAYGDGPSMDAQLGRLKAPVLGLRLRDDWLVPEASLLALLAKMGSGRHSHEVITRDELGVEADHFRWLRQPGAVVGRIEPWLRANP
jgi:predicted alpha/beta hydrolase